MEKTLPQPLQAIPLKWIALFVAVLGGVLIPLASLQMLLIGICGVAGLIFLLVKPEIAVGLFLSAGILKADPRLAALANVDLTVALAGVVAIACGYRVWNRSAPPVELPHAFLLYVPLVLMMISSLFYTPDLAAGAEKCARFVLLTGLGIVAPFLLMDSPRKLRTFLYTTATIGFCISADAWTRLGGSERLTTEGGITLQLGDAAGIAIAIFWTMLLPSFPVMRRIFMLPLVVVPAVALLGSGARGPTIGVVLCVALGLVVHRCLVADAAILAVAGAGGLTLVAIPAASYQYLSTLLTANSTAVLNLRNDLMALAWQLIREHPLLGVGIGGYPYYSPDPLAFGWPHNIFLELGAELGVITAAIFAVFVAWSFIQAITQVRDHEFPLRNLSIGALSVLIFGFTQMIKSGDINDNRSMWLYLGLPFLLQHMAEGLAGVTKERQSQQGAQQFASATQLSR